MLHRTIAVAGLTALAACGGTTLPEMTPLPEVARGLVSDIGDLPGTSHKAMPTTGQARFVGVGGMLIDRNPRQTRDDLYVFGKADVNVDFSGSGKVAGAVTNIEGVRGRELPANTANTFAVPGRIVLGADRSYIDADPNASSDRFGPNVFYTSYQGKLQTPDGDITIPVNGLFGKFVGTRAAAAGTPQTIKGIAGTDNGYGFTANGNRVDLTFDVLARNAQK